jgi:glycolate oxidase FAD binding subunit
VFTPLSRENARLHRELKAVFDPAAILNPGRLYPDL